MVPWPREELQKQTFKVALFSGFPALVVAAFSADGLAADHHDRDDVFATKTVALAHRPHAAKDDELFAADFLVYFLLLPHRVVL